MRPPPKRPAEVFLFVCTNRRPADNPLGAGCGGPGDELHQALRQGLQRRGASSRVWLARSSCLGMCPRVGAAVALGGDLFTEVSPAESSWLIDRALSPQTP